MSPTAKDAHPTPQPHKYTTLPNARKIIGQQADQLSSGTTHTQYLLFAPVPPRSFTNFDNSRYDRRSGVCVPKSARLAYDADTEELVVKIMGLLRLECSNQRTEEELVNTGATTYKVGSESREADSSFQPWKRGSDGWPSLVVGVGFEERVGMLRGDAGWWVVRSEGEVRITVVIRLCRDEQRIVVETWEMPGVDEGRRVTRSSSSQAPVRTQEVRIEAVGVWGPPLVLGFEKVVERVPVPPEGDIVFSAQDLRKWADKVWFRGGD
ncbi:hypothetical protein ACLOAV_002675 [Pseudogymnoascus australis]